MKASTPSAPRAARLIIAVFLCAAALPAPAAEAEAVLAGGTGSGSRLLKALADEYRGSDRPLVRVVDPPLGSGAAIKAVKEGRLQLAISARPLEGDETNAGLVLREFARTPFVFATRDGHRTGGFTLPQLADVYGGRLVRWENGAPIRLILRPAFDSDTAAIRAMAPPLDAALTHALERPGMVVASSDMEALELIESTPGSLGPTTLGLIRLTGSGARALAVAGRAPSATALADGQYPWFKTLYLVFPRDHGAQLQAFLDFLQSPRAVDFLTRTEHLPSAHAR